MAATLAFARRHGLDLLTLAVLAAAGYYLSQPLRDKWTLRRAEAATAKVADRKWGELSDMASSLGSAGAPVQVVEISDYQCPFCRKTSAAVDSAARAGLRIAYLNYPLRIHAQAEGAAIASICAAEVGRFHEMHERLMNTSAWQTDSNWTREASAAEYTRAVPYLESVVEKRPMESEFVMLGVAYLSAGRKDDAAATFRRMSTFDPGNAQLQRLSQRLLDGTNVPDALPNLQDFAFGLARGWM